MPAKYHRRHINDRLKPIYCLLEEENSSGVIVPVVLTGKTVTFTMVDEAGEVVVNAQPATIVQDVAGTVYYDFAGVDVDTPGTYYGYFAVTSGGRTDTFPAVGRELIIVIYDK